VYELLMSHMTIESEGKLQPAFEDYGRYFE
jgi:hypothetical protein